MKQKLKRLTNFLSKCFFDFLPLLTVLLALFLAIRIFEFTYAFFSLKPEDNFLLLLLAAFLKDIVFIASVSCWIFLVYAALYAINRKFAQISFIALSVVLMLLQLSLVKYFLTALVPLGGDIWGYSFAEIKQTVGAAGGLSFITVIPVLVIITVTILLFKYIPKKFQFHSSYLLLFIPVSLLFNIFSIAQACSNWKAGSNEFSNDLTTNKTYFFYRQSLLKFFPVSYDVDIYADNYIDDLSSHESFALAASFKYTDQKNFPFLHADQSQDVLSSFFDTTQSKPNFVFIIVEGLGRSFTNEGATLGNFTPFLDSLSSKSLYWPNFLSTQGRTFAVLPSLMGALPFGENGFAELGNAMPQNLNLFNLLKYNGYNTAFFYGGESHFDNMDIFVKHSNAIVNDVHSFPASYTKQPAENGFTWGYGDKELFKNYLEKLPSNDQPRLDVLLTVSMHSPFLTNEQQKYVQLTEKRINELALSENKKRNAEKFKAQFATIMYTDDAIKNFIHDYSQKPAFKNTIFIITGDHRMPEIPMENKLERYHVPLIIYSPLLKRAATFQSISTHFDVAPSILAFLKSRYNVALPAQTCFIGTGLDTSHSFGNTHIYPLKQTKTDLVDFLYGKYLLNNDQLYEITDEMDIKPVNNASLKNKITTAFVQFRQKNAGIVANAKLFPDSLITRYSAKSSTLAIK